MKYITPLLLLFLFCSCTLDQLEQLGQEVCAPRVEAWENGIIPFKFTDNTPQYHKDIIYKAIAHYEDRTVLTFVEHTTNDFFLLPHGVLIKYTGANSVNSGVSDTGMGDYITDFYMGGERFFNLSTANHELGHIVGLPHEHQRADRDEYIKIHWDNIPVEWHGNYKISESDFTIPFANESIMHYDPKAVAIDKSLPTVEMLDGSEIIRTEYLTTRDIQKINELYCSQQIDL